MNNHIVKPKTNNLSLQQLMILVVTTNTILESLPPTDAITRPLPKLSNGFKDAPLYNV